MSQCVCQLGVRVQFRVVALMAMGDEQCGSVMSGMSDEEVARVRAHLTLAHHASYMIMLFRPHSKIRVSCMPASLLH